MTSGYSDVPERIQKEARVAGLNDFESPTLEAVERRRIQLWLLASLVLIGLSGTAVLLTFPGSPMIWMQDLYSLRILYVGLTVLMSLYLIDKEFRLRRLTRTLVDERVLNAALSNRLKEVSLLSDVGKAMNESLDLEDVLQMILDSAVELLAAQEGSIMLYNDDKKELYVAAWRSSNEELLRGATVKLGEGIAGWVARSREPLLIMGKAPANRFKQLVESERPIVSAMSVPLIGNNELYGVLNVNELSGKRAFSEYDLRALGLFAEHAAIAIRNARAFDQERSALERLREVDRLKTDFMAMVSHELKTPLTSIIGSAKTIRQRQDDITSEQQQEFLQIIERQGRRLLRTIEEVLAATKVESGEPLRRQSVEVVDIARQVVQGMEATGIRNPMTIESPASVMAYGNPGAIEQILTNLVDNAAKYSESTKPIRIRLRDQPGLVTVNVIDEGPGISPEDLPGVFERFRQIDRANTRAVGGVGLGLYIVKNLVRASGGEISVESELGKGSTFTIKLPKRRE